jgi:hypothetical protein
VLCENGNRSVRSDGDKGVVVGPSGLREVHQGVGWTAKGVPVEKGVDRLQRMVFVIDSGKLLEEMAVRTCTKVPFHSIALVLPRTLCRQG